MKFIARDFIKSIVKHSMRPSDSAFGQMDKTSVIQLPTEISNPANIYIADHVNIGSDSVLYATHANIRIGRYFVAARGLKISTGQHERRIGRFLGSITEADKTEGAGLDKDVVINEDVWAGFDVTLMAGVEIGRGCTLAAGSVVTKSTPPYSIWGGVPAKLIRFYWTIDEIMEHEAALYSPEERYTRQQLEKIFEENK